MASFNGHSFQEKLDGNYTGAQPDQKLKYTKYPIPGSNDVVVISTGEISEAFEVEFSATASQLSTLQGDLGTSANLIYHAGTVSVLLVGVLGVKRFNTTDYYRGRLQFEP